MLLISVVFSAIGSIFAIIGLICVIVGFVSGFASFPLIFGSIWLFVGLILAIIGFAGLVKYYKVMKNGKRIIGTIIEYSYNSNIYINHRPAIDLIVEPDDTFGKLVCVHTNTNFKYKYPIGMRVVAIIDDFDIGFLDAKGTKALNNQKDI